MPSIATKNDPNGSAQVLCINTSNYHLIIGGRDSRTNKLYGKLSPGETALYCSGQGRVVLKKDGSVTLYTTNNNADDGKAVYFRIAKDSLSFVAPWGSIKFNDTGFHILHASGATLDLGGISGIPAPFDFISSYANIGASTINLEGLSQNFGSSDGATPVMPLANATVTVAQLANLQAQITALTTALTALGVDVQMCVPLGVPPGKGSIAPIAAASTAVSAGAGTLATMSLQIPTSTSSV